MILPLLKSCKICNFTLYGQKREIELDLNNSCIVLAGANGLGKSTFLNIIAFALTGMVKDFEYEFKGIYDIKNMNFTKSYFKGRISATDKNISKVHLSFLINNKVITVVRKFSGNGEFYSFNINGEQENFWEQDYKNCIVKEMGLNNYEQFIFLVHYVLLFDESRKMLFWDTRLLTNAINIILGIDPEVAEKADMLVKEINHYDSEFRNTQWQIKKIKNYISALEQDMKSGQKYLPVELNEEYKLIEKEEEQLNKKMQDINFEINSIKALITELSAKEYKLKKLYEEEYRNIFIHSTCKNRIIKNEYIVSILENNSCILCGSNNPKDTTIKKSLEDNICPLCNSQLDKTSKNINLENLEKLDKEISQNKNKLNNAHKEYESLMKDYENIKAKINKLNLRKYEIESTPEFKNAINYSGSNKALENALEQNNNTIKLLEKKKDEFKEQRDKYKKEAAVLRDKITNKFNIIKHNFIPIFNELAHEFIGLNVNLVLKETTQHHRAEYKFILQIDDSDRIFIHQLSESQKFFIDIALRMAFVIYLKKVNNKSLGFLLLDTPEGSLDIAYETNAGKMMSKYTANDAQLVMTANVNSSGLLLSLAKNTPKEKFKLVRMINWAQLSIIQKNNIKLIENVLDKLEEEVGNKV